MMTGREKLLAKLNESSNKDLATIIMGGMCPETVDIELCQEGFCVQCWAKELETEYKDN